MNNNNGLHYVVSGSNLTADTKTMIHTGDLA